MSATPWFKDWFNSSYYHQLYFNRDEQEAAAFIDRMIAHLQPTHGSLMLDVACGKGRHSIHLAKMGFDATGIDLSEDSIEDAIQFETENLHFFRHDMRLPFWINYYDYAFNFFTSFGYFNTQRENDNAIRTIAQSLKSNGIFVMDYLNVQYSIGNPIPHFTKEIDGVSYVITKRHDEKYFYKKIEVKDVLLDKPITYTEQVAKFSLEDFTAMFAKQGLVIQEIFGDYHLSAYDKNTSPRLIMIAAKKH